MYRNSTRCIGKMRQRTVSEISCRDEKEEDKKMTFSLQSQPPDRSRYGTRFCTYNNSRLNYYSFFQILRLKSITRVRWPLLELKFKCKIV